jgi:hypothetical protein
MNLAPLLDVAVSLASAVLMACIPIVTIKFTSLLGVKMDSEQRDSLNSAVTAGLGKALQFGQEAGDHALSNVTIKNAALATAVGYVTANAPDAVAHFGLTNSAIAEKVAAHLALALHETGNAPASEPAKADATAAMLARVTPGLAMPLPTIIPGQATRVSDMVGASS